MVLDSTINNKIEMGELSSDNYRIFLKITLSQSHTSKIIIIII